MDTPGAARARVNKDGEYESERCGWRFESQYA